METAIKLLKEHQSELESKMTCINNEIAVIETKLAQLEGVSDV